MKIKKPKVFAEETIEESNEEEEEKWETITTEESEEEEDEVVSKTSRFRPKFNHGLVDISDVPFFMTTHLEPLPIWTVGLSKSLNDKKQWFMIADEYIKVFFSMSMPKPEIKRRLGIGDKTYETLESRLMEISGSKFLAMSVPQRYYIYVLQMEYCIRQLNQYVAENINNEDQKKGGNVVNAIKTIAAISKDTLSTGQDLGIIARKAKEIRVLGELNLAVMPTEELKDLFEQRFQQFKEVVNDSSILAGPYQRLLMAQKENIKVIDVEAEEISNAGTP